MDGQVHLALRRRPEEHHRGRTVGGRELDLLPTQLRQPAAALAVPHPPHLSLVERGGDPAQQHDVTRANLAVQRPVLLILHPHDSERTHQSRLAAQDPVCGPRRRDLQAEDPHLPFQHGQRLYPDNVPLLPPLRLIHDTTLPLRRLRAARRSQRREGTLQTRQPTLNTLCSTSPTGELLPKTRMRRARQALRHPGVRHARCHARGLRRGIQPDRRGRPSARVAARADADPAQPAANQSGRESPAAEPRAPLPHLMARIWARRMAQARSESVPRRGHADLVGVGLARGLHGGRQGRG